MNEYIRQNSELVNDMYDDCINYRSPEGRVSDRFNGSPRVCTTLLGLEVSCEEKQSVSWDCTGVCVKQINITVETGLFEPFLNSRNGKIKLV